MSGWGGICHLQIFLLGHFQNRLFSGLSKILGLFLGIVRIGARTLF